MGRWLRPSHLVLLGLTLAGCGDSRAGTVLTLKEFGQIFLDHDAFQNTVEKRALGSKDGLNNWFSIGKGSKLRIVSIETGGAKVVVEKAFEPEHGKVQGELSPEFTGKTAWILNDVLDYYLKDK